MTHRMLPTVRHLFMSTVPSLYKVTRIAGVRMWTSAGVHYSVHRKCAPLPDTFPFKCCSRLTPPAQVMATLSWEDLGLVTFGVKIQRLLQLGSLPSLP